MRTVALVATAALAVLALSVVLLVWPFPLIRADTAAAQLEALKVALAIGAGTAGLATVLLAARRQVHSEYTQSMVELDASERRITDLYTKAVDQLGSERPATRLGALYALQRLAASSPEQRQTIVNVICAYLRMPYVPPSSIRFPDEPRPPRPAPRGWGTVPGVIDTWATMADHLRDQDPASPVPSTMTVESALAEWQVRIAAQRILSENLTTARTGGSPSGWRDIDVDLSGAALFDFDFRRCVARRARFRACRFYGVARFYEATFAEVAEFDGAEFFGPAWFKSARFKGDVWYGGAHFHRSADFRAAAFEGVASFGGQNAWLGFAVFAGDFNLGQAAFATPHGWKTCD
jgi:hypothetical protein